MSRSPDDVSSGGAPLLISVVVIGRNEGERLGRCLSSIASMRRETFDLEVIYVDSGSVDQSVEMARAAGVQTISLMPERPSAALGRNAGWRAAKGEFVLFLDGDTVLHSGYVANSLPEFAREEIAVIWGHRRELYPWQSLFIRTLDLDWIYKPGLTDYCGGDALFRRSVLAACGGFDESLIAGEEPELCQRLRTAGHKVLHVDHPMTGHDLAITRWEQYWRRAVRAGHAYAEVADRSRTTANPLWQDVAQSNQRHALILLGIVFGGLVATAALASIWPVLGAGAFLAGLFARSAWRARWKSEDKLALLLYGVHSHVQQIPIYLGQLQYRWNKKKGKRAMLIEYKGP